MYFCAAYIIIMGLAAEAAVEDQRLPPSKTEPADLPIRRNGDQITLKSGKVIHGVKIVRQSSIRVVLEVMPGLEPLIIPAKQVTSIQYGGLRARYASDTAPSPAREDEPSLLPAVKLSPDLVDQMTQPMMETPATFENEDIVNVLLSAGIMSKVPVSIGAELKEKPLAERLVTLSVPADASLEDFLRDILAREAPWVAVEFRYDEVQFDARPEQTDDEAQPEGMDPKSNGPGGDTTGPD